MPQNQPPPPADALRYLRDRLDRLERQVHVLYTGAGRIAIPRGDHDAINAPYEGEMMVNYLTDKPWYYSRQEWRPFSAGVAVYAIEVFENYDPVTTGDDKFNWMIPEDLDGATLLKVEGYVNTASGSGSVQIDVDKVPDSGIPARILDDKVVIAANELNSFEPPGHVATIDSGEEVVVWGDHLRVNVDAAGSGTLGLGMILYFDPAAVGGVVTRGEQGPPGGVTEWTGAYDAGDTYVTNQAVSYGGTTYVAITNVSAGIIPGVTPGWEDYWHPLLESVSTSALQLAITSNAYVIDTGEKGFMEVPFDCTIDSAALLADQATTTVVDIWKDTYGNFPPLSGDSICGASPLTISAGNKTLNTTLAGWDTSLLEGDILVANVDSNSNAFRLTVSLRVLR